MAASSMVAVASVNVVAGVQRYRGGIRAGDGVLVGTFRGRRGGRGGRRWSRGGLYILNDRRRGGGRWSRRRLLTLIG